MGSLESIDNRSCGGSMNDHNANELCGVLSGAYCFAELDVRITEALELADSCNHIGIDLAQLAAPLDAAARAAEAEEETAQPHLKRQRSASDVADVLPGERRAVLDVSAFDPHTANAVLTCAGRYCALVHQPGLALGHFRAALAASSTGGYSPTGVPEPEGSSAAEAHLGMVQSVLQLGLREHATSLTISFWRGGSAGGVGFASLTDALMLRELPGVFCAGEMLDWEAPTGGYLLTACWASGRVAGEGVLRVLRH